MAVYLPWFTFFIGVFVGWLLTWLIMTGNKRDLEGKVSQLVDDLHSRNAELASCLEQSKTKAAEFKAEIKGIKADLKAGADELKAAKAELEKRDSELEACASELDSLKQQIVELEAAGAETAAASRSTTVDTRIEEAEVDDFTQINGIGPALAARLSAAGIYRYTDLAQADADELPNALGIQPWQKVEPEAWIAEAALLAERPSQVQVGDDLTLLEGIGPAYAIRLRAAGITTFDQLGNSDEETLAVIIGAPAWRRAHYGDWITQARLAAASDEEGLKELQEKLFRRQGDNLSLIAGIGPQSAGVLHEGGIYTYATLAKATPEQLEALFAEAELRAGDFEAWIAEAELRAAGKRVKRSRARLPELEGAKMRSCPQDLDLIDGIGTIYEQRLFEVGVGTFWEVGMLPEGVLAEILLVQEFQDVDLPAIKADAMRLAEETDTMGHTWDGTEPDNFEPLIGIGPVLERRLYAAGVCTFQALAAQTVKSLKDICHAPSFQKPDYGLWIEQAKEMLSKTEQD